MKKLIMNMILLLFLSMFYSSSVKAERILKPSELVGNALSQYIDSSINTKEDLNALAEEIIVKKCPTMGAVNQSTSDAITSPVIYLRNNVAKKTDKYTVIKSCVFANVLHSLCSNWNDKNNCTITALYNLTQFYKSIGYSKIPSNGTARYRNIRVQAVNLGYTSKNGLSVRKIDNLVENTWRRAFGYTSGDGNNDYLWSFSSAISELNAERPFLLSLASGYYYNHTVAVRGYKIYKNKRTGEKYTFLVLSDGWSDTDRYLAWTNTGASYYACATWIIPPKKKN